MAKKNSKGSLVQTLFENRDTDALSFTGGNFSDKFVPPNKIIRKGTFDIDGNGEYAGIEFEATIVLGKLVPKQKSAA